MTNGAMAERVCCSSQISFGAAAHLEDSCAGSRNPWFGLTQILIVLHRFVAGLCGQGFVTGFYGLLLRIDFLVPAYV
ncbi:hypothetical protein IQ265_12980 [Nodosilinea sp. LEGE 06152]|nr:hypothetical protein [Nodosilinea sp. LEGE 06152]